MTATTTTKATATATTTKATITTTASPTLDYKLVHRAVTALLQHHHKNNSKTTKNKKQEPQPAKKQLLEEEDDDDNERPQAVHLQFSLLKPLATTVKSYKPLPIDIPHPLYYHHADSADNHHHDDDDDLTVCLIVKNDDTKRHVQSMLLKPPHKDGKKMNHVQKIITIPQLRTEYANFATRRTLLHSYTCFLADDRITPLLTSTLGKIFTSVHKQPVAVRVTGTTAVPVRIQKAVMGQTSLILSSKNNNNKGGGCVSIRAGHSLQTVDQLVANVAAILQSSVVNRRLLRSVRAIHVKTATSTALPIYYATPTAVQSALLSQQEEQEQQSTDEKTTTKATPPPPTTTTTTTREKKEKSPLLQALKKNKNKSKKSKTHQQEQEEEEEEEKTKETATRKKKKDKTAEKATKKRKSIESTGTTHPETTSTTTTTTKKKKMRKDTTKAATTKTTATTTMTTSDDFVAAKKYKGRREGFVFCRRDTLGLGYYRDVVPVVDKAAMAALAQIGQRSRGGGSKRKKNRSRKSR